MIKLKQLLKEEFDFASLQLQLKSNKKSPVLKLEKMGNMFMLFTLDNTKQGLTTLFKSNQLNDIFEFINKKYPQKLDEPVKSTTKKLSAMETKKLAGIILDKLKLLGIKNAYASTGNVIIVPESFESIVKSIGVKYKTFKNFIFIAVNQASFDKINSYQK